MKTEDIQAAPPSPWKPEDDVLILAVVGKCVEEGGEFFAKLGRIIVQGIDGLDPVTKLPQNRAELADEVADMLANLSLLQARLFPERGHEIQDRAVRKQAYLGAWHEQLEGGDTLTADLFDPILREPQVRYAWTPSLDDRVRHGHGGSTAFSDFLRRWDGPDAIRAQPVAPIMPSFVYGGDRVTLKLGEDIDADGYAISAKAQAFVRSMGCEPAIRPEPQVHRSPRSAAFWGRPESGR